MALPHWLSSYLNMLRGQIGTRTAYQPLLNDIELHLIQKLALTATDNPFLIDCDVQHQLLGERTSSYAGSGYEFSEHRRYSSGDDMRFIDWRVMARTGKLVRKLFHEERRPQVYLVVDRRAPMRFGTHQQLKVTCAVKQAIQLLTQARQQQLLTACVMLENEAHWLKPSQGTADSYHMVQQLNRACPPQAFDAETLSLKAVLNELAVRLTPGCIIYLLSDLHDLDEQASSVLYHLSQQHRLYARHILDPVELQLSNNAHLQFYDEAAQQVIDIDTSDPQLVREFAEQMQQRQQAIKVLIEQAGGDYRLIMTDGDGHG